MLLRKFVFVVISLMPMHGVCAMALEDNGAPVTKYCYRYGKKILSPWQAAYENNVEALRQLGVEGLRDWDKNNRKPIYYAVRAGALDAVKHIIFTTEGHDSYRLETGGGDSVLRLAAKFNRKKIIEFLCGLMPGLLLKKGSDGLLVSELPEVSHDTREFLYRLSYRVIDGYPIFEGCESEKEGSEIVSEEAKDFLRDTTSFNQAMREMVDARRDLKQVLDLRDGIFMQRENIEEHEMILFLLGQK